MAVSHCTGFFQQPTRNGSLEKKKRDSERERERKKREKKKDEEEMAAEEIATVDFDERILQPLYFQIDSVFFSFPFFPVFFFLFLSIEMFVFLVALLQTSILKRHFVMKLHYFN